MSAAGDLLNVSHAAVSQQVRALEAHLGMALVTKDGRGVRPTPEGERLGKALSEGFEKIGEEVAALTGADADRPLQITTTPMFAAAWLMPRLGSFRSAHPDIDLMINPTAERIKLEPGGVDVAIRFGRGDWPGLHSELLVETDFVVAARKDVIGDCTVEGPADLLHFPWLQEIGTTETNDWLARRGITDARVKSLTQLPGNLLLDGLRSGQGIAATSREFIAGDVARGDIVELFRGDDLGHGYFLLHRPGVLPPKAKVFVNWLRKEAKLHETQNSD